MFVIVLDNLALETHTVSCCVYSHDSVGQRPGGIAVYCQFCEGILIYKQHCLIIHNGIIFPLQCSMNEVVAPLRLHIEIF